ncbi:hypothetical protein PHYPSEUDO_001193 [Phytophthora pseudosyringae]|uniref:Uncharacterized protein n=1 Tax=Phytophthora pseudosyringae TaxID=221518 RepID=A0A8T1VWP4_9STRA|nr:hypothetical protein PHYPSEUDO_001193 [Phytophthora pseudosyringae]
MARTTDSHIPPYTGYGTVTYAQRDSAELERIRIRKQQCKLHGGDGPPVQIMAPLPVCDRGALEAHGAEKVARTRLDEQAARLAKHGSTILTRNAAALLRNEFETEDRAPSRDDYGCQWEERALRATFGQDSVTGSTGSALEEAFVALDEADLEMSPI